MEPRNIIEATADSAADNVTALILERVRVLARIYGWTPAETIAVGLLCAEVQHEATSGAVEIIDVAMKEGLKWR